MTKEEADYQVLTAFVSGGFHYAVEEAQRLFDMGFASARLKVHWVVEEADPEDDLSPFTHHLQDPAPTLPRK